MSRPDVPPYFRVSPRFWGDERVKRWSDDARLMALYLITCPHRTVEGIFPLPLHYIAADLDWSVKKVKKLFAFLEQDRFLRFDSETSVLLLRNALRYQFPENPNQIQGAIRRIKDLPNSALITEFQELVRKHCYRKGASKDTQGFPYLLDQVLAQRLAGPLGHSLSLTPTPTQAQTVAPPLTLTRRDGEEDELIRRYPHLASVERGGFR